MRVLSVQQPFAQLIVRGATRCLPRTSATPHRGTVAIYASAAAPPTAIFGEADRDTRLGEQFASQGWHARKQLLSLPRSSIVGTVRLVSVARADHVDEAEEPEGTEAATGDEFVWEFADAVEITPVGGVKGQMRLWTLPDGIAHAVAEAEAIARARQELTARTECAPAARSEVDAEIAAAAAAAAAAATDAEFWIRQRKRDRQVAAIRAEIAERKAQAAEPAVRKFRDQSMERSVARELARYMKEHRVRGTGKSAEVRVDHRIPYLAELFSVRDWVPVLEFELTVREHLRRHGGLAMLEPGSRRHSIDPYEEFSGMGDLEAQPRYYETDGGAVVETGFTELDRPRRRHRTGDESDEGAESAEPELRHW